jgi:hypothetical protein
MADPRETTKLIVRLATEAGAAYIVKEFIKGNVPAPTRIDKKITYVLGVCALVGFVVGKAGSYMDRTVDELFDAYAKIQKELNK